MATAIGKYAVREAPLATIVAIWPGTTHEPVVDWVTPGRDVPVWAFDRANRPAGFTIHCGKSWGCWLQIDKKNVWIGYRKSKRSAKRAITREWGCRHKGRGADE